jgi:hypothetical protein
MVGDSQRRSDRLRGVGSPTTSLRASTPRRVPLGEKWHWVKTTILLCTTLRTFESGGHRGKGGGGL